MDTMNDMTGKTDEEILESLNALMEQPVQVKRVREIRGFTHYAPFYDHVADAAPTGARFVEVGVWEGAGIIYLKKKRPDLEVIGVDWGLGQKELGGERTANALLENLVHTRLVSEIPIILFDSAKAAGLVEEESCWGVFIDADHTEAGLTRDLQAWYTKVQHGGWLAGDDYDNSSDGWPDVKKVIDKFFPMALHPGAPGAPEWVEPYTWALQRW